MNLTSNTMTISAEVVAGIAPQWPALATDGSLLSSYPWVRAMMAGGKDKQAVTIIASENGEPKAAALATVRTRSEPGEFYDLHHVIMTPAPALPLTEKARAARAELLGSAPPPEHWVPSLTVMLPGYECEPVGPGRADRRVIGALVDAACEWAADHGLHTIAFLYTRPEMTSLAKVLTEADFVAMPLSLTWDLPVPDGGFAGYLDSLPGKRAREARRELARLHDAGVRLRHLDHETAHAEPTRAAMTALRTQLVRKYRSTADERRERAKLDMVIADVCGGRAEVFAAEADDGMLGFGLFAPYGSSWYCLATGYDYTDPRSRTCYFATLFYTAVPAAGQRGISTLSYGQGSARAKRSRGCAGTPLTGWLRSADPSITAAARASAAVTRLQSAT